MIVCLVVVSLSETEEFINSQASIFTIPEKIFKLDSMSKNLKNCDPQFFKANKTRQSFYNSIYIKKFKSIIFLHMIRWLPIFSFSFSFLNFSWKVGKFIVEKNENQKWILAENRIIAWLFHINLPKIYFSFFFERLFAIWLMLKIDSWPSLFLSLFVCINHQKQRRIHRKKSRSRSVLR